MWGQFVCQECGHLYPGPLHVIGGLVSSLVTYYSTEVMDLILTLKILNIAESNDDGALSHLIPPTHQV